MRQRIVKIDSDGRPNTTVISTDDGKELDNVQHVNWSLGVADGISRVTLDIVGTGMHSSEGILDGTTFICQLCGHREEHICDSSADLPE